MSIYFSVRKEWITKHNKEMPNTVLTIKYESINEYIMFDLVNQTVNKWTEWVCMDPSRQTSG